MQDTCHMMPFTKQHSAYAWVVACILFLINLTFRNLSLHSSYKIHQPFTDYFLRLPYSELLEKRLFRSRANRRLVSPLTPTITRKVKKSTRRSHSDAYTRQTVKIRSDWHKSPNNRNAFQTMFWHVLSFLFSPLTPTITRKVKKSTRQSHFDAHTRQIVKIRSD